MRWPALFLALLAGCASRQRLTGTSEIVEIRLNGEVVVGFTWTDPVRGRCRRFVAFREGDRLAAILDDGTVIESGVTLVSVVPDRVLPYRFRACPERLPPVWRTCYGPGWVTSLYATGEAVYENRRGWRTTVRIPSKPPATADLCRLHGGSRPDPERPPIPPPSRSDLELSWMLYSADDGWLSKNPAVRRRSRNTYQVLQQDYRDAEVVRRNLNRIARRADEEIEE